MPDEKKLVRIKPSLQREIHIFEGFPIKKSDGWCALPADVADRAAEEPVFDQYPDGDRVFDVKEMAVAARIERAERKKIDPAGTAEAPKELKPTEAPADRVEQASPAARRGSRRATSE